MIDFIKLIGAGLLAPFAMAGFIFLLCIERLSENYGAWGFWVALSTFIFPIAGFSYNAWGGIVGIFAWVAFWMIACKFIL
jgi:hypothetical protein